VPFALKYKLCPIPLPNSFQYHERNPQFWSFESFQQTRKYSSSPEKEEQRKVAWATESGNGKRERKRNFFFFLIQSADGKKGQVKSRFK
jgi:hypothetical protein